MSNSRHKFISSLFIALVLSTGCRVHQSARRNVPLRSNLTTSGYGSFLQITYKDPSGGISRYAGEFIGVRNDSLFAINQDGLISVSKDDCSSAILILFKNNAALMPFVGIGGTVLSGVLNGSMSIISAPLWITGSVMTGTTEAVRPNNYIYPKDPWSSFIPYARFPQGLPSELDLTSLEIRIGTDYQVKNYIME